MDEHCEHGYLVDKCMRCDIASLRAENERLTALLAASESVRRNADARVAELGERLAALRAAVAVTEENVEVVAMVLRLKRNALSRDAATAILQAITTRGEAAGGVERETNNKGAAK